MTIANKLLLIAALGVVAPLCRAADVQETWDKQCASCHGKDGSGNTRMGKKVNVKDYRDPKVQADMTDAKATQTIKDGIKEKGEERMKPYKDKLSDDEIKALIAHMRTFVKK